MQARGRHAYGASSADLRGVACLRSQAARPELRRRPTRRIAAARARAVWVRCSTVLREVRDERRYWIPARRRDRQPALYEILIEPGSGERWQGNLAELAAFAEHVQPVITVFVAADVAEGRAD